MHNPPRIPPTRDARPRDVPRLAWWTFRGFLHSAHHGRGWPRALSAVCAAMYLPAAPLMLAGLLIETLHPRITYYLTDTAALAIKTTETGWTVHTHTSAHPGTGQGRALRETVLPELLAFANRHQLDVTLTAATAGLAATYQEQIPGLRDAGPAWPRGRRLLHKPST